MIVVSEGKRIRKLIGMLEHGIVGWFSVSGFKGRMLHATLRVQGNPTVALHFSREDLERLVRDAEWALKAMDDAAPAPENYQPIPLYDRCT